MIHWGWLIVAGMAGAAFGAFIMAIFAVGSLSDDMVDCLAENQRLKDELQYLKDKLA